VEVARGSEETVDGTIAGSGSDGVISEEVRNEKDRH
jgi:hypothetical protein